MGKIKSCIGKRRWGRNIKVEILKEVIVKKIKKENAVYKKIYSAITYNVKTKNKRNKNKGSSL